MQPNRAEVQCYTSGVPGNSQRRYANEASATRAFNAEVRAGRVRRVGQIQSPALSVRSASQVS